MRTGRRIDDVLHPVKDACFTAAAVEFSYRNRDCRRGAAAHALDAIIVLGGAIAPRLSRAYGLIQVTESGGRIFALGRLAQAYPNARIVYSGGDAPFFAIGARETDYLYSLLDSFGIRRQRVPREDRSRNTRENAIYTKQPVKPKPGKRWLLVTSTWHVPRTVGCFSVHRLPGRLANAAALTVVAV